MTIDSFPQSLEIQSWSLQFQVLGSLPFSIKEVEVEPVILVLIAAWYLQDDTSIHLSAIYFA